ncbi:HypC/HybG/HupF family hydrogenase formation chaperone [Helicobacter saguini]|uniref:HypC/HybG/HupF family hydrogenase formation chaperone n=1 Tax=Helicobacter saguini TaxID=1548018 RepID=A0A347VS05_9HELI|nr:HypC/HybG/HupF family hydrogenase formation chaperone [Helicobacter saguini]MWV62703.1 HypC/HybG/HupF family hydrogenase formation chaperone [Helicobacter saguini]MWV66626.1 HypC/HybG/HupF family hydrogenase formation chaperone [Helicobacter saguini]MWV68976.1 HypC/HybG/HupF family hydrogenase formation chaperone [Helicobacter saguini]MWV71471.1 HypC/HybG/HupF family hydrogenase formation chaperone [Helicobacter saguini]TLD94115.1 HypC/HybG/HupF family hydrogenase formation chaperone [Helic
MCLAIPSKVIEIKRDSNTAVLDTLGVRREASLDLMQDNVSVGEFVLLHVGYVMGKIDEEDAKESLKLYAQMIEAIKEEDEEIEELNNANRI